MKAKKVRVHLFDREFVVRFYCEQKNKEFIHFQFFSVHVLLPHGKNAAKKTKC